MACTVDDVHAEDANSSVACLSFTFTRRTKICLFFAFMAFTLSRLSVMALSTVGCDGLRGKQGQQ